jgi:tocopherol cyclase
MPGKLARLYHPSWFQGSVGGRRYFEGWYFKQVSKDRQHVLSVIPGISLGKYKHAFVQVLDGITGASEYFEYDISDFRSAPEGFDVRIGPNRFSENSVTLDIHQRGKAISGALRFSGLNPYPVRLFSPGIMGWYAFVPFMECYHGVVSMTHRVDGAVEMGGIRMDFSAGKGYMEKDWGTSFPESWVWTQCNNFEEESASFMLSVAKIPWLFRAFPGFISFLRHQGSVFTFATYTGAKVRRLEECNGILHVEIVDRRYRLYAEIRPSVSAVLKAPRSGNMDRHIKESVDSEISVNLSDLSGKTLFEGKGSRAGLERVGEVEKLLRF